MTPIARVSKRTRRQRAWTFGIKFEHWLTDEGLSLNAFAKRTEIPQSTLHNWVRGTTRPTAVGLDTVSRATGLPAEYWMDPSIPYPPPMDYLGTAEDIEAAIRTMGVEEMSAWIRILSNPESRRRALLLLEAAEHGRS